MLTTGELTAMRATVDTALPDTIEVQRATRTADGAGGLTEVWATIATVAGRISPALTPVHAELMIGERPAAIVRWLITVPAGTDVDTDDRLAAGARVFEVRNVAPARSWELAVIAHCTEIL